jgi:hypothetical protein
MSEGEYGIIANIAGVDRCLRLGSKAWITKGKWVVGQHRTEIIGRSRSGRLIVKWLRTEMLTNFRCAWLPEHILQKENTYVGIRGDKDEITDLANRLSRTVDEING